MAKEVSGIIKLQIKGGSANPSPPVGPALGAKGVNIMEFCKQFNARTQDKAGKVIPVIITVFTGINRLILSSKPLPLPFSCWKLPSCRKDLRNLTVIKSVRLPGNRSRR
jgi:hypothetical protein